MSFSYSSGIITQTGTDVDLSGLAGVNGVTATVLQEHTTYELDYQLRITGTLNQKANEYLEFSATGPDMPIFADGGAFTVNGYIENNDLTANLGRPQILAKKVAFSSWQENYGVRINSNSSVIINGGYIKVNGAINTMSSSSYLTATGGCYEGGTANDGNLSMLRAQFGGNINIDGLIALKMTNALTEATSLNLVGFAPRENQEGLLITTGTNINDRIVIEDYNPLSCEKDIGYYGGSLYLVYGFPNTAPTCGAHINRSNPGGLGIFELRKVINFTVKDLAANVLQGVQIAMSDTNQPTTRSFTRSDYNSLVTGLQILNVETYLEQTDASGNASIDKILCYNAMYSNENVGTYSPPTENLYKTKAADHNYIDDAYTYKYGYLTAQILNIDLTGLGQKSVDGVLFGDVNISEASKATVSSYSSIETHNKFYDRASSFLEDNFGIYTDFIVLRSGNEINAGTYNINIDKTAGSAFAFDGSTITIKASSFTGNMTTTGIITLSNGATFSGTRTDANGTVLAPRNVSVTGIVAGSRIRVYNTTTSAQVVNEVVSGTSYTASYAEGVGYSIGDVLDLRVTKIDKLEFSATVVAGSAGWNSLVSQSANPVYAAHGVNGATVLGISWDSGDMQFDFNEADNQINGADIGAWYYYFITTEIGIAEAFAALSWPQINKITNVTSKVSITFDNTKSTPLRINNCWIDKDNGSSIIATASNSIQIDPPAVFVTSTGQSGLTAAQAANLNLIPALL